MKKLLVNLQTTENELNIEKYKTFQMQVIIELEKLKQKGNTERLEMVLLHEEKQHILSLVAKVTETFMTSQTTLASQLMSLPETNKEFQGKFLQLLSKNMN